MSWFIAAVLAGTFSGGTNFLFKQMSVASASIYAVAAFMVFTGLGLVVYGGVTRDAALPSTVWGWAAVAAAVFMVSNIFLYRALNLGGPVGLVYGLYGVLSLLGTATLGMIFAGEKVNWMGWAGMACAVVAIVLMVNGKGQ